MSKTTNDGNMLSITLVILEEESFKPHRLTTLPVWLMNFAVACGLAHSNAAYDGGLGVYCERAMMTIGPLALHVFFTMSRKTKQHQAHV